MKKLLLLLILIGLMSACTKQVAYNANAVDLGLSVMWADVNLGTDKPELYGWKFRWGETKPVSYSKKYKWGERPYSKYNAEDGKRRLDIEDDAAHLNLGSYWRLPTNSEWSELLRGCNWTWTTMNGLYGYKVISKTTNESIFFPFEVQSFVSPFTGEQIYDNSSGAYLSASLDTSNPDECFFLYIDMEEKSIETDLREYAGAIRPVKEYVSNHK